MVIEVNPIFMPLIKDTLGEYQLCINYDFDQARLLPRQAALVLESMARLVAGQYPRDHLGDLWRLLPRLHMFLPPYHHVYHVFL